MKSLKRITQAFISISAFAALGYCVAPVYSVMKTITLTGTGSIDFLTVDEASRRLFIARGSQIVVVDIDNGTHVGSVAGMNGAHGAVAVKALNKGFATNGGNKTVSVFDLTTLAVTASITVGSNPDHIIYDSFSNKIFCFNNSSANVSVIDPATNAVVKTIDLGPVPELSVSDGAGHIYVGLAGSANIGVINTTSLTKETTWSIAPDQSAKTISIDTARHRLYCGGKTNLNVINTQTGTIVATTPNIANSDGNAFDPDNGILFATGGNGDLFVIQRGTGDTYTKVSTIATGCTGTNAYDSKTHSLFVSNGSVVKMIGTASVSINPIPRSRKNILEKSTVTFTGEGVIRFQPGMHSNWISNAIGRRI